MAQTVRQHFRAQTSVARFEEISPFGEKMTFSWEIFPDLYVVNGEFLAASLFIGKYLGNFKIPYVVNGEFIKIFWGISKI
jgi:hypothetical protein